MVAAIIQFGDRNFELPGRKIARPQNDLDSIDTQWQTTSQNSFTAGNTFPGFSGMEITLVETETEVEGSCYLHRLQGRGVAGNKPDKLIRSSVRQTVDGWDDGRVEWLTKNKNKIEKGDSMDGYSRLKCIDVEAEDEQFGFFRVRGSFRGLLQSSRLVRPPVIVENDEGWDEASAEWLADDEGNLEVGDNLSGYSQMYCFTAEKEELAGGDYFRIRASYRGRVSEKTYSRRITVNENVVSPSQPFINLLPNGWGAPQKGQISLPRVVVTDSYVSTTAPPTSDLPGNSVPDNAPSISDIVFSDMELVRNWPYGWKLASIDSQQVPGKNLWLITLAREFVWDAQPA